MVTSIKVVEDLKPYIDEIWYVNQVNEGVVQDDLVLPTGHMHIILNFADAYYLVEDNQEVKFPDISIIGQFKEVKRIKYDQHIIQVGIAIRPSAFYMFFGKISGLYTETIVDASYDKGLSQLFELTGKNNHLDLIVPAVEAFFLKRIDINHLSQDLDEILIYIETAFSRSGIDTLSSGRYEKREELTIGSLCKRFGLSVSKLERDFKKYLGLTPKAYLNIIKFRYSMLLEDPTMFFYDQAHFIKTCMKYTGKTPGSLAESNELTLLHILGLK